MNPGTGSRGSLQPCHKRPRDGWVMEAGEAALAFFPALKSCFLDCQPFHVFLMLSSLPSFSLILPSDSLVITEWSCRPESSCITCVPEGQIFTIWHQKEGRLSPHKFPIPCDPAADGPIGWLGGNCWEQPICRLGESLLAELTAACCIMRRSLWEEEGTPRPLTEFHLWAVKGSKEMPSQFFPLPSAWVKHGTRSSKQKDFRALVQGFKHTSPNPRGEGFWWLPVFIYNICDPSHSSGKTSRRSLQKCLTSATIIKNQQGMKPLKSQNGSMTAMKPKQTHHYARP